MTSPLYEWDTEKAQQNLAKHGVPFDAIAGFDWMTAIEAEDTRFDYGEKRMQALGKIGER
ncbi:uncharacterized DUF497 family protein [Rhodobacteraceae bacterium MBR-64]|jgi:uncharacterized DUF497 family protein